MCHASCFHEEGECNPEALAKVQYRKQLEEQLKASRLNKLDLLFNELHERYPKITRDPDDGSINIKWWMVE